MDEDNVADDTPTTVTITHSVIKRLKTSGNTVISASEIHIHNQASETIVQDPMQAEAGAQLEADAGDASQFQLQRDDRRSWLEELLNKRIKKEFEKVNKYLPHEIKHPRMVVCKLHEFRRRNTETLVKEEELFPVHENENIVFENIFEKDDRFVAIVGGPGSGKRTSVTRYGHSVLEREINEMGDISIVHFIDASELCNDNTPMKFFEFFFSNLVHGLGEKREATLDWIKDERNQAHLLIVLVGLVCDREWKMNGPLPLLDYESPGSSSQILHSILSGRLLPRAKILATTRGYRIQNFHKTIAPKKIIKLTELSEDVSEYIFNEKMKIKGKNLRWGNLSKDLKSLCTIPIFLCYVTDMFQDMVEKRIDNASSVILNVLRNFASKYEWKSKGSFFSNLKKFAFYYFKMGQIRFTEEDLEKFNLKIDDMKNICEFVQKKHLGVKEPYPDSKYAFFTHYLLQESLACLGFLQLKYEDDEFKDILNKKIHQPHFHFFLQLACGILFNKSTAKFFEGIAEDISDMEIKAKLLAEIVTKQLSSRTDASESLRSLKCVCEMGDEQNMFINKYYPDIIDLCMIPLSSHNTRTISRVLVAWGKLSELSFYGCSLQDSKVEIIWEHLGNSQLTINFLDLGRNKNLQGFGLKMVARVVNHCKVKELDLHCCDLDNDKMKAFADEIVGSQECPLKGLCLRGNKNLGKNGMKVIARIVQHVKLRKLDLTDCGITGKHLNVFMNYDMKSLEVLLLTRNTLEESGLREVGQFVARAQIKELHINWCKIRFCDLVAFETSLKEAEYPSMELPGLNVSNNKELVESPECLTTLCAMATKYYIKQMDIHNCDFPGEWKKKLEANSVELMRMDAYVVLEIGTENFENFLKENRGRYREVSLRKTTRDLLKSLSKHFKNYNTKLRKLCLSEGRTCDEEDAHNIVELFPYISEELWLGEWKIDKKYRDIFQRDLNGLKQNLTINFSTKDIMTKSVEDPISLTE